jgi:hypothetical protein
LREKAGCEIDPPDVAVHRVRERRPIRRPGQRTCLDSASKYSLFPASSVEDDDRWRVTEPDEGDISAIGREDPISIPRDIGARRQCCGCQPESRCKASGEKTSTSHGCSCHDNQSER